METEGSESGGVPIQYAAKKKKEKKKKKNTTVMFREERPGARKARNREKWAGVYVGDPDETESGESGELDDPDDSLYDAVSEK